MSNFVKWHLQKQEQQVDENKRVRPREQARGQKFFFSYLTH